MPRRPPAIDSPTAAPSRRVGVARALSKLGLASRTLAAEWVRAGRVTLNGRPVHDPEAAVVLGRDRLCIDGHVVRAEPRRYLMLNKPRGLVTTRRDEHGRDTVYRCLPARDHGLAPVGRLDKASEGLLLFTNDSEWASRLLDPASHVPKCYHVQIDCVPDAALLTRLRGGVDAEDGPLRADAVALLRHGEKTGWLAITLAEGKNRQIRRLCAAVGVEVLRLVRVAIGPLELGHLAKGACRELTDAEREALTGAAAISGRGATAHAGLGGSEEGMPPPLRARRDRPR